MFQIANDNFNKKTRNATRAFTFKMIFLKIENHQQKKKQIKRKMKKKETFQNKLLQESKSEMWKCFAF